jgi:hypothetical protein
MGSRGATMADTVGKPADQARADKDSRSPMPSRSEVGADEPNQEVHRRAGAAPNRIAEKRSVALAVPFYAVMAYLRRRNQS